MRGGQYQWSEAMNDNHGLPLFSRARYRFPGFQQKASVAATFTPVIQQLSAFDQQRSELDNEHDDENEHDSDDDDEEED